MASDLRYALRTLLRNPGFAAVAIVTLALGIGANTAIFSVFNAILLRPLPYSEPNRLIAIQEVVPSMARFGPALPVTAWHFREWIKQNHSFERIAMVGDQAFTLTSGGEPVRVSAARVSASLFPLLGIQTALGRTFLDEEDQPGRDNVAILSDRLWTQRFHRDPAIVGGKILLNGVPFEVVGILPPGAKVPTQARLQSMAMSDSEADVWKPFAIDERDLAIMAEFNYGCIGRLKRGVTMSQAAADLNVIQQNIARTVPEKVELGIALATLQDQMTNRSRHSLILLLSASGAVLLIVIVNLANLLLARATARQREFAIRTAIGAGIGRLVRQTLVESLLLAGVGGALGIALADWTLTAIILKAPLALPGIKEARIDAMVLIFAVCTAVASGVFFGVLPALRMSGIAPESALRAGGRSMTDSRQGGNVRRALIAAEVALSAICLVAGGLLLNSFIRLEHVDKGFQADRAVTVGLGLPPIRYPDASRRTRFIRTLLDKVESLPGVVAAGVNNRGPLSGEGSNLGLYVEGVEVPDSERPIVDYRCVSSGYFHALGIPLLSGRTMEESDRDHQVSVISAQTARKLWPGQNPIGKRFRLGASDEAPFEVVGVVGDIRASLNKPPNLTIYVPYWQVSRSDFALAVRLAGDSLAIAPDIRATIHALDPQLVVPRVRTLDDVVDASLAQRRFQMLLVMVFAVLALLLAAIGVYGVVSQTVTQRTNEIGIRMALGATRSAVWRFVAARGLVPVMAGLAVGLLIAAVAARIMRDLLFGVPATDPVTFAAVASVLLLAAILACCIPAVRATRVDPLIALRYE